MSKREGGGLAKRERTMLVVLGVVAAGALAFLFLSGGEDEPITVDSSPPVRPTIQTPPPDDGARPPLTDGNFGGRDPFEPLVSEATAGPPDDSATPGSNGNGSGSNGGDGTQAQRVTLVDIYTADGERFATVDVDGREYTVSEGETFAGSYRLLDLRRRCGDFVYGDERFTLCIGQEVQK